MTAVKIYEEHLYTNCAIQIFIILTPLPLIFFRVANKTQFPALAKLLQKKW
jgi:hypothetical protein